MTHTELIARLQAWMETSETTMVANLDFMIELAEERIYKSVDLDAARVESSVALAQGTSTATVPSSLLTLRQLTLVVASSRTILEQKDVTFLDDYSPNRNAQGTPRYYAWIDEATWLLAPAPDATAGAGTLSASHTIRPSSMTAANPTTWLGTYAPDVLFYASMMELSTFLKQEPDIMADFKEKYQQAIQQLLMEQNYLNRQDEDRYGRVKVTPQ